MKVNVQAQPSAPRLAVSTQRSASQARRRSGWRAFSWLRRRRREPTIFEKCLAVHMYFAASPTLRD